MKADAYKKLKVKFSKNPFVPNLMNGCIVWGAHTTVNATDVR